MGDENDLHDVCAKVGFNKLSLYLVGNNLVHFYGNLLKT